MCIRDSYGTAGEVYFSEKNVYFATGFYNTEKKHQQLRIDKFSYHADKLNYLGLGVLDGNFSRQADSSFFMSEKDDLLRIVLSKNGQHFLHVIETNDAGLSAIASIPNTEQPASIGKPNEDIRSVRFIGDKA